jgi:acetyltransferase-like isoleucine patch superfamily enzyme
MAGNRHGSGYSLFAFGDVSRGMRLLLWLGLIQQLVMMGAGLWPAAWLVLGLGRSARTPLHWALIVLAAVLVFNYGYLLALLLFRAMLPRPREGFYVVRAGRRFHRQVVLFFLNLLLVKARYEPPWAVMFTSVLANTFPLRSLFARVFGPRSRSTTMGDTMYMIDPYLVEIGRDVQLGFHCTIIAHVLDQRGLLIRRVRIGDGVIIGGESTIMPGTEVGHHAVVGARSLVRPDTRIGPYEFWAGVPARKIRDLSPDEELQIEPLRADDPGREPQMNANSRG